MRENSRWHLTDFQRLLVVVAVASAFFLSAISLGAGSIIPLLVAMVLVVGAGLGVFLLGLRFTGRSTVQGHAYVIMAQPPPVGKIVGRCDMRLLVEMPGRASNMVKFRDPSVPVTKWPAVGTTLPVEVSPRNPRQLRVRWEMVDAHAIRTGDTLDEEEFGAPSYTQYGDDELRGLDDELSGYDDLDDELRGLNEDLTTVADDVPPPRPGEPESLAEPAAASTPDTILGDEIIIPPHLSADLSRETGARGAEPELPTRSIPQPRPAESLAERRATAPVTPSPNGQSAVGTEDGPAMGMMLVVSDLNRSLRFYRDLVGFSVVDGGANVAVLGYGGGRVLLRQLADMSPVDRRVAHLHISVPDVDASYKDLKDRGVEFMHRPRVTSRSEKLDLWAATFRDPDGHDIALTQWKLR